MSDHAQLSLFSAAARSAAPSKSAMVLWQLYIDGASRNNPGKAGVGIYLLKNEKQVLKKGFYIGIKTNNQAEYLALLIGLYYAQQQMDHDDALMIFSDSLLLVRQMQQKYKVRHPELKPLYACAQQAVEPFNYDIGHVLREDNTVADEAANEGIDKKRIVPQQVIQWLRAYEIII